jgi:aspartate aminotransferase-like enzyme
MPRFYFDLAKHRDVLPNGQTPWTPAVGIFFQLEAALELIEAEGLEAIYRRHAACGAASRAGLAAMGFELYADQAFASNTVTSALVPEALEWSAFNKALQARGLVLAGGQGKMKGRIFRIGHLGDVSVDDIVSALDVIEQGAGVVGLAIEAGAGQAAARSAAGES